MFKRVNIGALTTLEVGGYASSSNSIIERKEI
jgi:ERCC4-type nuclease